MPWRPTPSSWLVLRPSLVLVLSLVLLAGCASSGRFDGTTFQGQGMKFRLGPASPSWERLQTSHGLIAFRDRDSDATILVNGRCDLDRDDIPLPALTHHLFLRFTEKQISEETLMPFDGREALRTVLDAKLDGVPRAFVAVVTKKDGCVYDFVLITTRAALARDDAAFRLFYSGFRVETRP